MTAYDVCKLVDPWQKLLFETEYYSTITAAASLCTEFVLAIRGLRKVGEPMEPGWTLHVHSSKGVGEPLSAAPHN